MSGKNYLELCNDILEELYYEKVDDFSELDDMAEGRRVKKMLNQALSYICNNENEAWEFRNKQTELVLVPKMKEYDRPNGFIQYMKYTDQDLVLQYVEGHRYLPNECYGMPVQYYISNDKLNFFPIPSEAEEDRIIKIEYYTDNFAEDCCGMGKPKMEYATDTPIIPARHRDILIYKVCADWRGNERDGQFEHYQSLFKKAYRALRMDCARTADKPKGFNIMGSTPSFKDTILNIFYDPYTLKRKG